MPAGWLGDLLFEFMQKLGVEGLASTTSKIQALLEHIRESFPVEQQVCEDAKETRAQKKKEKEEENRGKENQAEKYMVDF